MFKQRTLFMILLAIILAACSTPPDSVATEPIDDIVVDTQVDEPEPDVEESGSMPEPESKDSNFQIPAIAWYGKLISTGNDFHLHLYPEGSLSIHLTGINADIDNEISALRDVEKNAHFWGEVTCGPTVPEDCLLTVEKIRVDGPGEFFEPDPITWQGTFHSVDKMPGSGDSAYFLLDGPFNIQYGFWVDGGKDNPLTAELLTFIDTGAILEITGELFAGRPTWNGTQIIITGFHPLTE